AGAAAPRQDGRAVLGCCRHGGAYVVVVERHHDPERHDPVRAGVRRVERAGLRVEAHLALHRGPEIALELAAVRLPHPAAAGGRVSEGKRIVRGCLALHGPGYRERTSTLACVEPGVERLTSLMLSQAVLIPNLVGTFVFALSGGIAGVKERVDVFGLA